MTSKTDSQEELLTDLFEASFEHPYNWADWRRTLAFFALMTGFEKETILEAHRSASRSTGATAGYEVGEGFDAEEDAENMEDHETS